MSAQRLAYISDLIDEEWPLLAPLLPAEKPRGRPCKYPMPAVLRRADAGSGTAGSGLILGLRLLTRRLALDRRLCGELLLIAHLSISSTSLVY